MKYRCENGHFTDDVSERPPHCPECMRELLAVEGHGAVSDAPPASRPVSARRTPELRALAEHAAPSRLGEHVQSSGPPSEPREFEGRAKVEQRIREGYGTYLVCGIAGVGKSEFLSAVTDDGHISMFRKLRGMVVPTAQRSVRGYALTAHGRKLQFLDASGEEFRKLYPAERERENLGPLRSNDLDFLRIVSRRMRGIVLLLHLRDLWHAQTDGEGEKAKAHQVDILVWILMLLRFLRFGGAHPDGATGFQDHVDATVRRMRRRLDVPVLLLFSKADEHVGVNVPDGRHRQLFPVAEDAMLLAYHAVPKLFTALTIHCRHFRCDFEHALVVSPDTQSLKDDKPCGVALAREWLVDPHWEHPWRWWRPPSNWLIQLRRGLNQITERGRMRWRRLPLPEGLD